MELLFLCSKCSKRKIIDNPIVTRLKCDCGGFYRISLTQMPKGMSGEAVKVNPDDEKTTLMDAALESKKPRKELSEALYRFKVVMCPKCGWISVTEAEKSLKCRGCNKVSAFRSKGCWNVRLKSFPTHEMACVCAKEWTMREGKNIKKR